MLPRRQQTESRPIEAESVPYPADEKVLAVVDHSQHCQADKDTADRAVAAADLEVLPVFWKSQDASSAARNVIEFPVVVVPADRSSLMVCLGVEARVLPAPEVDIDRALHCPVAVDTVPADSSVE